MALCGEVSWRRREANFQSGVQRVCYPLKHGEGMAFVVGIFEAGDYGLGCADEVGEFGLGEFGAVAGLVNKLGNAGVQFGLGDLCASGRVIGNCAVENFERVACFGGARVILLHRCAW